jgi:thiol-disulfide isomerase/thioredoxin
MIRALRPLLLAALLAAACAHAPPPPVDVTLARVPDGARWSLSERHGAATVVYFFTTWCVLCQGLEPQIAEVAVRGAPDGVEVVGIALDLEGQKLVAPYVAATKPPYPVLLGGADVAQGRSAFGPIPEVPTVLILDREGRIRASVVGLVSAEALLDRAKDIAR